MFPSAFYRRGMSTWSIKRILNYFAFISFSITRFKAGSMQCLYNTTRTKLLFSTFHTGFKNIYSLCEMYRASRTVVVHFVTVLTIKHSYAWNEFRNLKAYLYIVSHHLLREYKTKSEPQSCKAVSESVVSVTCCRLLRR